MKLVSSSDSRSADPRESASEPAAVDDFSLLYQRYRHQLYLYCLRRTHDPATAEDIVQEVFAKAFRRRSQFDTSRPFWPWIVAMASRRCIDVHRRRLYAAARTTTLASTARGDQDDPTAAAVVNRIESRRLERALAALPARQRAALQLFALDGWSYPEIAEQLGCSAASIKQLIVRARTTLRHVGRGALGALGCRLRAWQSRGVRLLARVPWLPAAGSGALSSRPHVAAGVAAFTVLVSGVGMVGLTPHRFDGAADRQVVQALAGPEAPGRDIDDAADAAVKRTLPREPTWRAPAHTVEQAVNRVVPPVPQPSHSAEDPNPYTNDFAVSPGYHDDGTVYAAGGRSLLVSRDGGASWHRAAADGLLGGISRVLLPPAYPADNRVFVLTWAGLQVSRNGGDTFETLALLPLLSDAALSPAFGDGHPGILLAGNGRLYEYRDDTGLVRPLVLQTTGRTAGLITGARYAASYPDDPTILVSTQKSPLPDAEPSMVLRCRVVDPALLEDAVASARHLRCDEQVRLPGNSIFAIGLRPLADPRLRTMWATAGYDVYVSLDNGRSFRRTVRPLSSWGVGGDVTDLAVVPGSGGKSVVVAQGRFAHELSSLERTDDGGLTWTPLPVHVDVAGFESEALAVTVTPTGRILAAGGRGGLACSTDGGRTWAPLCARPDGA